MIHVPLDKLLLSQENGFENPRRVTGLDEASLQELADSVIENGLLYPLLVWQVPEGTLVIDGQRRVLALRTLAPDVLASIFPEGIPCLEIDAGSFPDAVVKAVQTTVTRSGLSSYELAEQAMVFSAPPYSYTGARIAQILGKDPSWVSRMAKAYQAAGDELLDAWCGDLLTDEQVQALAELSKDKQPAALAEVLSTKDKGERTEKARARAGKSGRRRRTVKAIERRLGQLPPTSPAWFALRWALGEDVEIP